MKWWHVDKEGSFTQKDDTDRTIAEAIGYGARPREQGVWSDRQSNEPPSFFRNGPV